MSFISLSGTFQCFLIVWKFKKSKHGLKTDTLIQKDAVYFQTGGLKDVFIL